jgi:peptidoglycan L-alanyl-D-glutamate endopeptidase CwlK
VQSVLKDMQLFLDRNYPHLTVVVTEGFRTAAYQNRLWKKGRTTAPIGKAFIVTNCDGYINKSPHQSSCAIDIAFKSGNNLTWTVQQEVWDYYGHLIRQYGLEWGGDWKSFKDQPHCQVKRSEKETFAKAQAWQKENGLR